MTEFRRILCPTDFSDVSRHALEHAVELAKQYHAELTALHVVHVPFVPEPPMLPVFTDPAAILAASRQTAEERLQDWLAPARDAGVKVRAVVLDGHAAAQIVSRASAWPADLIALGTHGLSGFDRLLLGSVTEKVLRKASCPVLTVPPAVEATGKMPYRRLLCPVDFSDVSVAALRSAVSLASRTGAAVTVLHVFDWPPEDQPLLARFDVTAFRQAVEGEARARLQALITSDEFAPSKALGQLAHGKPYRAILEVAKHDGIDVIVIGVRGRNPLDLALFGSTTNHVIRMASCPVLTVKG